MKFTSMRFHLTASALGVMYLLAGLWPNSSPQPTARQPRVEEADMSQRRTLAHLHEELRSIDVLDRIYDYATEEDPVSERAFAIRQLRRKQIQDDIGKLSKTGVTAYDWLARAVVVVCAFSYVMLYFLFR